MPFSGSSELNSSVKTENTRRISVNQSEIIHSLKRVTAQLMRLDMAVIYLQYGSAVCFVRTEPEVPAMGSVTPPTVVFALRGVLPRYPWTLASPRADSLEGPRLLESGPIRWKWHKMRHFHQRWCGVNNGSVRVCVCALNLQSVSSISASASLSPWGSDNTHSSCRGTTHAHNVQLKTKDICLEILYEKRQRQIICLKLLH